MDSNLNLSLTRLSQELWAIQIALIEAVGTPRAPESGANCLYPGVDNDSVQDVKAAYAAFAVDASGRSQEEDGGQPRRHYF